MNAPSAQFVEPQELRMLRNSLSATQAELLAIEYSLMRSLDSVRSALQRTRMNRDWVAAVECTIKQEQRT